MRVSKEYLSNKYGEEKKKLMMYITQKRKEATSEDIQALYKRAYSWLLNGTIHPDDEKDIDAYVQKVYELFKKEHPDMPLSNYRIERKEWANPYMILDNIKFSFKRNRK